MPGPARRWPAALDDAVAHLRASDHRMRALIDSIDELGRRGGRAVEAHDHYGALLRAIVGQQLSAKVARVMNERMLERFGGRPPTPAEVLAEEPEELRAAIGLSRAKVSFLRSLAEHVTDGSPLELERMSDLPDDEVIAELVAVKGIGEWTAQMFLIFHLERPDVLATGDLGIRAAMRNAYDLKDLPAPAEMVAIAEPWQPHRSTACRFLWRSLDNEPN